MRETCNKLSARARVWKSGAKRRRFSSLEPEGDSSAMMELRDYRQHLEVETPEHVVIDYEIAGLGSRALAAIVDSGIIGVLFFALGILFVQLGQEGVRWLFPIFAFSYFAILWGYFALFEGLRDGQTPGKKWLGIRVIRDTGHPATMREAAARNLLRVVDFLPPPYLLGALFVAFHPKGKRVGDLVAGTVVVRDGPVIATAAPDDAELSSGVQGELASTGAPLLTDSEFRLVREFGARAATLPRDVQEKLASQIVTRIADRIPMREGDPVRYLATVLRDEGSRRRGKFAGSAARRAPGGRTTNPQGRGASSLGSSAVVERLVAQKEREWNEFDALAKRATRGGLSVLTAPELPDFAARYRAVAADLARVRTYGADVVVRSRLERLVAAGHNLLYRDRRRTWREIVRYIAVECPAGIVEARRVVLAAFLAFALPALGGYAALRERPELAERALPSVLLERAEAAASAKAEGKGYAYVEGKLRGIAASSIIANNIGVAFACFAFGIFFGVGSLMSLAFNGLAFGAASGHYRNLALLGYLWRFVAGHGVLELFAIWCAGGGGFLLGLSLIRPGDRSRRDALVLNARLAMRLVASAIVLLLVAGTIEGFLSTSNASTAVRVSVSVSSLVLLSVWLWNGARHAPAGV